MAQLWWQNRSEPTAINSIKDGRSFHRQEMTPVPGSSDPVAVSGNRF